MFVDEESLMLTPYLEDGSELFDSLVGLNDNLEQPNSHKRQFNSRERVNQFINESNIINASSQISDYPPQNQYNQQPDVKALQQLTPQQFIQQCRPVNNYQPQFDSNSMNLNQFNNGQLQADSYYDLSNQYRMMNYMPLSCAGYNTADYGVVQPYYFGQNALIHPQPSANPIFRIISSQSDLDCQLVEPPIKVARYSQDDQSPYDSTGQLVAQQTDHYRIKQEKESLDQSTDHSIMINRLQQPIASKSISIDRPYDMNPNRDDENCDDSELFSDMFDDTLSTLDQENEQPNQLTYGQQNQPTNGERDQLTNGQQDQLANDQPTRPELTEEQKAQIYEMMKDFPDQASQETNVSDFADSNQWKKKFISKLFHSRDDIINLNNYDSYTKAQCDDLKNDPELLAQFKRIQKKGKSVREIMYKNRETKNAGLRSTVLNARKVSVQRRVEKLRSQLESLEARLRNALTKNQTE